MTATCQIVMVDGSTVNSSIVYMFVEAKDRQKHDAMGIVSVRRLRETGLYPPIRTTHVLRMAGYGRGSPGPDATQLSQTIQA